MLDAIGDLALAGHPLRGVFIGHRSGHGLNNRLLRALLADQSAYAVVDFNDDEPAPAAFRKPAWA